MATNENSTHIVTDPAVMANLSAKYPLPEQAWEKVGLTEEEFADVRGILGRDPNWVELGLYGLMWSEHCSYKTSKRCLRTLPTSGPRILQGPGENAGVVDLGDGLAVAFKIESHNHPSAIEPYQGAATGVGGIIRDIFAMGARPIALMDPLRFGPPDDARTNYLIGGVVAGIAGYGNCMGIPTVGGETVFEDCYRDNPLINVFCLGILEKGKLVKGLAKGTGNPVFLVGSSTGRDGIHGASLLASRQFNEKPEEQRPAVQVGDPFMEKLLLEACLELLDHDWVVGIQDLGAAGLTSAASETASRGGHGMDLDIAKVPRREPGMNPYEVMLSESQERMLVIVKKGFERQVESVFQKWELHAVQVGVVTGDGDGNGRLRILDGKELVADVPVDSLAAGGPAYHRPEAEPAYLAEVQQLDLAQVPSNVNYSDALMRLLSAPNISAKDWVYRQYDHMVRTNTVVLPGSDATVLRIKPTMYTPYRNDQAGAPEAPVSADGKNGKNGQAKVKGIAISTDSNGRYCYLDPYAGAALAVAEAARNVVCSGAEPVAITNCLNFGNPEKPEVMWQFARATEGMGDACRALGTPVTGGNVSFYNDTMGKSIYPTPVVGMVGYLDDVERRCQQGFTSARDVILLLGATGTDIGGSEYLKIVHGMVRGLPPKLDLDLEKAVQKTCLEGIRRGIIHSAHDCSDGGLAVAVAECCLSGQPGARGAQVWLDSVRDEGMRVDVALFSETPSRIVVTVDSRDAMELLEMAAENGAPATSIGIVTDEGLTIYDVPPVEPEYPIKAKYTVPAGIVLLVTSGEMEEAWRGSFPEIMEGRGRA